MRKTSQFLLPPGALLPRYGGYDIYPSCPVDDNIIFRGFNELAELLAQEDTIIIDGYTGVFFDDFGERLSKALLPAGKKITFTRTMEYMKSSEEIEKLVSPFLGGADPLFGKRAGISLRSLFIDDLPGIPLASDNCLNILIGPGASLFGWPGMLLYIDLPKNEIQFRSRAGSIANLGAAEASDPKVMYKRFYFVDWPVLNRHKQKIAGSVDIFIDGQHPDEPAWMRGDDLRRSLKIISRNVFRARPWFEPGAWGGSWIKRNIAGLNSEVPNYAWSFELITPENGILLDSSGKLLEISFDMLMFLCSESILGDCSVRFGNEFPIRFDFLDTYDGGNLSIQCHPRPEYIKEHFGESFTQEETYYILDTKDNAVVYLGFTDSIDPGEFRDSLETSYMETVAVNIGRFVQEHTASKHDLFLIPYGTIHGSGRNNLVLEISSTPYIFTFKMYDWLRPDLDGKPRQLNIQRAMDNLYFERNGQYVKDNLISKPVLLERAEGWELWHLPTHETHLYDVHRLKIKDSVEVETKNNCHVLSLVEGNSVTVETGERSLNISYAETFIIPAAAKKYRIINRSSSDALVVKAFVK
jgi:mannose-6-phosphate isomerase class I